jgi:hypothetical protein
MINILKLTPGCRLRAFGASARRAGARRAKAGSLALQIVPMVPSQSSF